MMSSAAETRVRCAGSGGAAFATVMQAADLRDRHDPTLAGRCDWARDRCVLVQGQVSAGPLVIRAIELEETVESRRAEDDDVIEALAAD